jgi:very-short-patch-repair endonuclease
MTLAETMLWRVLRCSRLAGYKFRRQVPVGIYVADFLCLEKRLIVELDGASHDDLDQRAHDQRRDAWLQRNNYRILRIPNDLVIGGCDIAVAKILTRCGMTGVEAVSALIGMPGMPPSPPAARQARAHGASRSAAPPASEP